jgi:hypothetical protein
MKASRSNVPAFSFGLTHSQRQPRLLALVVVVAILCLGTAIALQANPGNPQQKQPTARPGRLSAQQIGDALTSYGKNTQNINGQIQYSVTVSHGKAVLQEKINLSPDGTVIWMTINIEALPDLNKVPATALANLLKKNLEIGPMFFDIQSEIVSLTYPVPNYDMTPALVKAYVETLATTCVDTMPLWDLQSMVKK